MGVIRLWGCCELRGGARSCYCGVGVGVGVGAGLGSVFCLVLVVFMVSFLLV